MSTPTKDQLFTISGALREGWELTKVNIGFLISYQIILFIAVWLFFGPIPEWKLLPMHIIGFLVITLGKMGFINSSLLLTKGLKPGFDQCYRNWRLLLPWIAASFLYTMLFIAGFALLIVPGLYVMSIFGFFPFFILDKGSGPIEALHQSADATKGMRNHILLFILACIGLNLLGFLFFGVGILITGPVTLIAMASVYEIITGQGKNSIQPDDILR